MDFKFKVDDIIRISNEQDRAYKENSLYRVEHYNAEGNHYILFSFKQKRLINIYELCRDLPKDSTAYKMIFKTDFENSYRLATEAEILLYGQN